MLFCSIEFIFFFFPVFLFIYYNVPMKYRNMTLFLGSLFFYWYGERKFFVLILLSLIVHYSLIRFSEGRSQGCRKVCLILMLLYGFGMLFVFKYLGFFAENWNYLSGVLASKGMAELPLLEVPDIKLPLGISFYSFQIAAYAIDVYRGQVKPEKNFVRLGAFLCMFPQLIAGPIVLYHQVSTHLKLRAVNWRHMENGFKTFILGLSMKMLLANTFGVLWNQVQTWGIETASIPMIWLGALAYTFQIYFDFQGYSMMAMGLGEILGFRIPRNFRHPYTAVSVTDFWRRWHITLSGWFKNYVYIPLGGNKKGLLRTVINLFIVWFLTGLWHGASWNFIIWGLYYFVLLMIEKVFLLKILEKNKLIGWLYTMIAVITGWVIFALDDMNTLIAYLERMFCHLTDSALWSLDQELFFQTVSQYGIYLIFAIIFSTSKPFVKYKKYKNNPLTIILLFALFLLCVYKLYTAASNPFLYFRF